MSEKWAIELVNKAAEEEILSLDATFKAKFLHITELILKFGPFAVGMPHIRPLEDKLWEIRMHAQTGIARSVYVVVKPRRVVILHTFIKKTQKTPRAALEKAKSRLKEVTL